MKRLAISTLTICGIDELALHSKARVTNVLSLLDPGWPELEVLGSYGAPHRLMLRFHDIIEPLPDRVAPEAEHVNRIIAFADELDASTPPNAERHLLVHCHMGLSRSTAAMLLLLARLDPAASEPELFARLRQIRPQAWPNSRMISLGDNLLGRRGRLVEALRDHYGHQVRAEPNYIRWMMQLKRGAELEMAR
ncbi:protein-tyrosine-phosphatase [Bosea caraganae]|uniref:Protein-tyrosine-phosphatase n=1 Tax=Bosea caraganae TaxID=2763117 RepID=A0A370L5I9_9HYPH|nr:protein-tyrosine-phosphatase [Bosea caraganae]RDJ24291.1 protein-tyrosine-phosphatase [Bosea caraganae]RDJ30334.1 protein-tyrosine-phosphatase [Bosea caraganae]